MERVHIGCSGWNYRDWRERLYPKGMPPRDWLAEYARHFDTVEVNATFYRLASRDAVAGWVRATGPEFVFAVKGSRYITHMKRLTDMGAPVSRFYEPLAPLVESDGKLGPVLWQLQDSFKRDDDRLGEALNALPPGRHAFELRHPSWYAEPVYELLRWHNAALVIGHHPERPWVPLVTTADWTFLRFHYGARGHRGNYSETELRSWAGHVRELAERHEVFAYFNNDWEGFAPRNATRLRELVGA